MAKKDTAVFVLGVEEIRMKLLRASTEHEMILEFLKAESTSVRFAERLKEAREKLGFQEEIITKADLQDALQNAKRKKLLGVFRGYGEDRELFERFPKELTEWSLCSFSASDFENIRYIDYSYWNELSAGTRKPLAAAETIRRGVRIFEVSNEGFLRAAEYIKGGGSFPKLFFITADYDTFVIVEGHQRMTAYALVPECFEEIEVIVGKCSEEELRLWM